MKTTLSICILLLACVSLEARPKRSVLLTSPLLAQSSVISTVPVVHSTVVNSHPHSIVKTESVNSADHASYSYSSEVRAQPVAHYGVISSPVVTSRVVAAPVVASPLVAPSISTSRIVTSPVVATSHLVSPVHHNLHYNTYGYLPAAYSHLNYGSILSPYYSHW